MSIMSISKMTTNHADIQGITADHGRGFLGNLTPDIVPHYPYRGREEFQNDLKHAFDTFHRDCEWFIVSGITQHIFESEFKEQERAHFPAGWMIMNALQPMGLEWAIDMIGSATKFADIGGKEADAAWRPRRRPLGRSRVWPSVVLQVAFFDTKAKLQSDVRYWYRASNGDVKVILTLHIDRHTPLITVEQWETGDNSKLQRTQSIEIYRHGRQSSIS
ncbi:uncharacterized protein BJX67DRAFT_379412 [Aspergillus lucknowensis]|uniref:Uncharacterized protein n=1 Tax=Aspergillus lucknowensis TaxID=176173 RepID=A0ABR4LXZ8_9EURO